MKKKKDQLGSGPIEQEYEALMVAIARAISEFINPDGLKKNGFVLMMFPFEGREGRCNYISNAERADVVTLLKEQLSYFEGMSDVHTDHPSRDN